MFKEPNSLSMRASVYNYIKKVAHNIKIRCSTTNSMSIQHAVYPVAPVYLLCVVKGKLMSLTVYWTCVEFNRRTSDDSYADVKLQHVGAKRS